MEGYCSCACRDCFEIAIGPVGEAMCHECETAGCDSGESECSSPHAYGGDEVEIEEPTVPPPPPVKKWLGSTPTNCDLCQAPFKEAFVDGATRQGPWGLLCLGCHRRAGRGLGLGKGQKYDLKTLVKIEG